MALIIEETSFNGIGKKLPTLTDKEKGSLESNITTEEIKEVIKKSKNNKWP